MVKSEELGIFLDDFMDCLNEIEEVFDKSLRAVRKLKIQIGKLVDVEIKPHIPEETFTVLKWQSEKGSRLGDYEVAYKSQNVLENWQHAFNILKQSNAVIGNRFHGEGYVYAYWVFPEKYTDRIFRKKLKEEAKG